MFILERGLCQSAIELINSRICKGNTLRLKTKKGAYFCPPEPKAQSTDLDGRSGKGPWRK